MKVNTDRAITSLSYWPYKVMVSLKPSGTRVIESHLFGSLAKAIDYTKAIEDQGLYLATIINRSNGEEVTS